MLAPLLPSGGAICSRHSLRLDQGVRAARPEPDEHLALSAAGNGVLPRRFRYPCLDPPGNLGERKVLDRSIGASGGFVYLERLCDLAPDEEIFIALILTCL